MPADGQPTTAPSHDLLGHIRALRRRWKLIAGLTLLVLVAALGMSLSQEKQYEGIAKVVLTPTDPASGLFNPDVDTRSDDPERDTNTKVALITFETVADRVKERLDL